MDENTWLYVGKTIVINSNATKCCSLVMYSAKTYNTKTIQYKTECIKRISEMSDYYRGGTIRLILFPTGFQE